MKKTQITMAMLAAFLVGCGGCKMLDKGADPVVVRAEQTYQGAHSIMDSFLRYEYNNRAALQALEPKILEVANGIRRDGPRAVDGLMQATEVYKANKTPENRANLNTFIALVDELQRQAMVYIGTMKINKIID